jgi:signal transduction histidine kinase
MILVVTGVWLMSLFTLALLLWRRPYSFLDLWLIVVMGAWLFDIALSAVLNAGRFDLGFYAGRIYGLLAASIVLMALLIESSFLYSRLARANQAVDAANKESEAFAYSVAHDLRTPIRGMAGFSQILIEDFGPQLPPEAQEHLQVIQREGQRMGQLIDEMLNLSRVTRGALRREPVSLSALASEALAALRAAEPQRQIECVVAEGLTASGDARQLKIMLDNLLGNAWKFTGYTAAPRIEFGVTSGNGGPAFYVRDNGAGFDMAYADKLFGAFQRLHTSDEFPGTGIGLAIVHRIVNRHGGRVWAEGVKNQGATFRFTL